MIAMRHRDDPRPTIAPLAGLSIEGVTSAARMAALQGRAESVIQSRFDQGHRAYVATVEGVAAAWGWVATATATIGEVGSAFSIPSRERYLWNFVTLESHRGMGIYPRLIDAIVSAELSEADLFWIAYAPENHASASGIRKAGFTTVAELSFDRQGRAAIHTFDGILADPASMLGLPRLDEALAQCWRCVRMGRAAERSCKPDMCQCDYQRPQQGCAA